MNCENDIGGDDRFAMVGAMVVDMGEGEACQYGRDAGVDEEACDEPACVANIP